MSNVQAFFPSLRGLTLHCVSSQLLRYIYCLSGYLGHDYYERNPYTSWLSNILSDNVHGGYVLVTCGSTAGKLFFNKVKNSTGKLRSVSWILKAEKSWCSPSELESSVGKANSKNWKRSICHDGKPLGLSDPGGLAEPPLQSQPPSLPDKQLIKLMLAFVVLKVTIQASSLP